MHRAPLLALLILAPLGLVPSGAAGCDATAQLCWDEAAGGNCDREGWGWSEVHARNVMLGFPVASDTRGQYTCAGKGFVTRDVWTNATAGTFGGVFVHWQTQETGWRWMEVRVVGPAVTAETDWWGTTTCNLDTRATVAGTLVSDRRPCPVHVLPPQMPSQLRWGDMLP